MELYFLRHGIAADREEAQVAADAERPLTDEGIKKMTKAAEGMKKLGFSFDKIVSSPYVRARHTAEIAAEGIKFSGKIKFSESLTPESNFRLFSKLVNEFSENERVLFVGHQPTMGSFISELVTGANDFYFDMKKGSLCRVDLYPDINPIRGELKWLLTSKILRQAV